MWSHIIDVIQTLAQLAMTVIAGFGAWVAYQTLLRIPVQAEERGPEAEGTHTEAGAEAPPPLKVFETSKQTTSLRATANGLECSLEDRRPGKGGGHQWTLSRDMVASILENGSYRVTPGYRVHSGLFHIGSKRNWLYSKKLFPEPEQLEIALKELMERAIA